MHYLLTFSLYSFILVVIYKRYCKFSIFWIIQAYKLVCLLGITFEKDQKT